MSHSEMSPRFCREVTSYFPGNQGAAHEESSDRVPVLSSAGEDDGHLVTFTQCANDGVSEMRVYNAKTMSNQPVARVQLPIRCPSGFHCFHMSEEQFKEQAGSL